MNKGFWRFLRGFAGITAKDPRTKVKTRPNSAALMIGLTAAALTGCAKDLIHSNSLDGQKGEAVGVVYALPKGQVHLAAQRKRVTTDDVAKAQAAAVEAAGSAKSAKDALDAAKAALEKSKGELNAAKPPAIDELRKKVALDQATVDYLTAVADAKKRFAATEKERAEGLAKGVGRFEESATVAVLPNVPDAKWRYIADFQHSSIRSDNSKLTVSNGLLSTTTVTSTDETKAILASLAGLVGAFLGPAMPPGIKMFGFNAPELPQAPQCEAYNFSAIFDPTDRNETLAVLSALYRKKSSFGVEVEGLRCSDTGTGNSAQCIPNASTGGTFPQAAELRAGAKPKGLVYRAPRSVAISVAPWSNFANAKNNSDCELVSPPNAVSMVAVVPDSTASFVLPAKGGAFTTATIGHTFKDGMLTEYAQTQPSEVAGAASIPIEILKAIVSVPAELVRLRVDYDSQANAALEAKIKAQELQLQLLNAQRDLEAARAASATVTQP